VHNVVSANWLELSGNKYLRQKSVIVINVNEGDPVFVLIKDLYIVNSSLYCFECQVYNTVGFSREFTFYEIEVPNLAQATEIMDSGKIMGHNHIMHSVLRTVLALLSSIISEMCVRFTSAPVTANLLNSKVKGSTVSFLSLFFLLFINFTY